MRLTAGISAWSSGRKYPAIPHMKWQAATTPRHNDHDSIRELRAYKSCGRLEVILEQMHGQKWMGHLENRRGRIRQRRGDGGAFPLWRILGAKVHSFDLDPRFFACTTELRRRYFPGDPQWTAEQAPALDAE